MRLTTDRPSVGNLISFKIEHLSTARRTRTATNLASLVGSIPRAAAQSLHTDCEPHLGRGEKMPVFRAISWKNRWAIRSGRRWSELIGAPTASIDVEQSCRLGLISVVASLLAVSVRHQGSNTSHEPSLRILRGAFSRESGICIGDSDAFLRASR
jgi:hypothetical protein